MATTYPTRTTKPEPTGYCECPLGYAPSVSEGPCFYCNHTVRAKCHIDYGATRDGARIVSTSEKGSWPIRYAAQTVLPRMLLQPFPQPGYWVDLPEVRKHLEAALEPQRPIHQVRQAIEDVVRLLPER